MTDAPFSAIDRRALRAVATQFFVNGALFASFLPRLPEARDRAGISIAQVGTLLAVAALAGLVGSVVVGPVIARFGTRRVMIGAGSVTAMCLPLVGVAQSPMLLLVGLVGILGFDVLVDVSMNMQGSWLSARRHAPVMNRLHGLWSLGTLIGGALAFRLAAAGVSLTTHLLIAGLGLLTVVLLVGRSTLRADEQAPATDAELEPGRRSGSLLGTGLVLGLFALGGAFALAIETSANDWAAFRLADDFGAKPAVAALGYVAVAAGMTIGRFAGDWVSVRLGAERLIAVAAALCFGGLATATLSGSLDVTIIGFAAAGLGIATLLPTLYDQAARHPGRIGAGLAALTGGLRIAALTVPIVIGTLAGTRLSVGSAIAIVALPSIVGFVIVAMVQSPSAVRKRVAR